MRFPTLADWLRWQESLHPKSIDLGLDRVCAVFDRMGLTRPAPVVVTVAGTNGKGSCVAFLDAMLRAGGYKTGAYTSPHLLRYNERVIVDGEQATDEELVQAFQRVDDARGDISLTYFEFGTLAAFDLFERAELDVAILEVGLGGRLDAVNIIDADCALITTIGLDHSDWLGPDRDSIAKEKAGIMRKDRSVVFGDRDMPETIRTEAERIGASLCVLGRDFDYKAHDGTWTFHVGAPLDATDSTNQNTVRPERSAELDEARSRSTRPNLPKPALPGAYQLANAAACLMVLEMLRDRLTISDEAVAQGLQSARLAGRLQRVEIAGVEVILDVAHNPQAAASLASALEQLPEKRPQVAVFAQLRDKDHAGVVAALRDQFDHWHLAGLESERGLSGHELANRISGQIPPDQFTVCSEVRHALDIAVHGTGREGRVVVFGSFHTVEVAMRGASRDR